MGGMVRDQLERIAKVGDEVEIAGVTLLVESVEGHAVTQVSMPWPVPGAADDVDADGQEKPNG